VKKTEHRKLGVELFNLVWTLLERKKRTAEEVDAMIHAAHASRHHWSLAGTSVNLARGEWQISRVYSVLGRSEGALYHAGRCLEICRKHGIGDFDLAYAYEALSRAASAARKKAEARKYAKLARVAGERIAKSEDRDWFFKSDYATLPAATS